MMTSMEERNAETGAMYRRALESVRKDFYFTLEAGGQLSVASGTVWLLNGQCALCGAKGDVLEADPEQAGYGTPICQTCITELFAELQKRRQGS